MGNAGLYSAASLAVAIVAASSASAQSTQVATAAELRALIDGKEKELAAQVEAQRQTLNELRSLLARLEGMEAGDLDSVASSTSDPAGPPSDRGPNGVLPSQNIAQGTPYGDVSCALRVVPLDDVASPALREEVRLLNERIERETGNPNAALRLPSPELAYAVDDNPHRISECATEMITGLRPTTERNFERQSDRGQEALARSGIGTVIPGRPLQLGGLTPSLQFGSGSAATINLTVPFTRRETDSEVCKEPDRDRLGRDLTVRCAPGWRPQVVAPFVEVSTPLERGTGTLFTARESDQDATTDDFDFADKIALRAGLDFVQYRGVHFHETERAISKLLDNATKECLRAVRAARDPRLLDADITDERICSRDTVIDWVLAVKADGATDSGYIRVRPELAESLLDLLWAPPADATPAWGFGFSARYQAQDFAYRQAQGVDQNLAGQVKFVPDLSAALATSATAETNNWQVELHGLVFLDLMGHDHRDFTPVGKIPGILFVPQLQFDSNYAFLKGTSLRNCDVDSSILPTACKDIQIDRPRRDQFTTASLEARWQMLNIPFVDRIGMAPKISYQFDDAAFLVDFPIYFESQNKLSSGIRFNYGTGLNDVLGNPLRDELLVSIFFTPLRFTGY